MLWPESTERSADGMMRIGGVALIDLARRFGTPLYVFDEVTLRARARRVRETLAGHYGRSRVLYAGKAYLSPAIVRLFHEEGLGLDVVSGGELYGAILAGMPGADITFHGNNKSEQELREAVAAGVGYIALDNDLDIDRLDQIGRELGTKVPALLRINPGIDVHTHHKIRTGVTDSKFGFPLWTGQADQALARAASSAGIRVAGFHLHLGSQLFDPEAARLAVQRLVEIAARARAQHGVEVEFISPGGGFGIAYTEQDEETVFAEWARITCETLMEEARAAGLPLPILAIEPGRTLVGPAAVAVYEVGAIKTIPDVRTYASVDGGMADNIRPTLYDAVYTAELVSRASTGDSETVTIAGRYCESGDMLINDIALPTLRPGDLIAMPAAGAYALPMASNYNAMPRPAVVMVRNGEARVIRRRETYADVFAAEVC